MLKIEDNFFQGFNDFSKKMLDYVDKQFDDFGITRVQWVALNSINDSDNLIQAQLAKMMNIRASTVVRIIDRMEINGLINRSERPKDRRKITLSITQKGVDYVNRLSSKVVNVNKSITKSITNEELEIFDKIRKKIMENTSRTLIKEEDKI
jgi:DNA-binding MarR family transcriptional regulator